MSAIPAVPFKTRNEARDSCYEKETERNGRIVVSFMSRFLLFVVEMPYATKLWFRSESRVGNIDSNFNVRPSENVIHMSRSVRGAVPRRVIYGPGAPFPPISKFYRRAAFFDGIG
jgi:hypothetical protein